MQYDDQSEVIDFLKRVEGGATSAAAQDERVIQTHISVIVLKGDKAWKLKRAVRLPYADFSTPALRLAACKQEVLLNRRTAASIYLDARRITREADGELAFDGTGPLVDATVEMRRFDNDTLFSKLAAAGRLDRPLLTALARKIAGFHEKAQIHGEDGGGANIDTILTLNEQSTEMAPILGDAAVHELRAALRAGLAAHREHLDARARAGRIRRCHGDLHLRNLCLVDGRPTLFDCIEFNDSLAIIDTLYDLAFLLMDLWQAGLRAEANWVMNRYMDESGDTGGLPLLPYFMALRASIRAQVLATQAAGPDADSDERNSLVTQAHSYLALAMRLLQAVPVRLLAVGGLSGSGKSTVAAALAHQIGAAPGARILATDRIRKSMAGVSAETRLPPDSYTLESSQRVYASLYKHAAQILGEGWCIIADAVFSRAEERQDIEQQAMQTGVPFQGVWLETDPGTLLSRVEARRGDPSDATAEVVKAQLKRHQAPTGWQIVSAGESAAAVVQQVLSPPPAAADQTVSGPPSWFEAPTGWNWLAQDEDGNWFWYAVQPQPGIGGGVWRSPRRAQQFAGQGSPNPLWYESCQQRPDKTDFFSTEAKQ